MKNLLLITIVLCIPFLSAMGGNEAEEQKEFLVKNLLEKAFGSDDHDQWESEDKPLLGADGHGIWKEDNEPVFGGDDIADLIEDLLDEKKKFGGDEDNWMEDKFGGDDHDFNW